MMKHLIIYNFKSSSTIFKLTTQNRKIHKKGGKYSDQSKTFGNSRNKL